MQLDSFAQVVIKEEVYLSPKGGGDGIESGLTTPFYGDVDLFINNCSNIGSLKIELTVGNTVHIVKDCNCIPNPMCTCIGNLLWIIEDQPAYSPVSLTAKICSSGTWIDLSVTLGSIINNVVSFTIYHVNYPETPQINKSGTITFAARTPPGCDPEFDCEEENPSIPEIILDGIPSSYNANLLSKDPCQENPNWVSFFSPTGKNISDFSIVEYCFNLQTQTWQYKMDNSNIIKIKNIIDYCTDNLPPSTYFVETFDDIPHWYKCSLISTYEANLMKTYGNYPQYILKPIVFQHEMRHYAQADSIVRSSEMVEYFRDLYEDKVEYACEDFEHNSNDALRIRSEIYSNVVFEFQKEFAKQWNKLNPQKQEQYLQNQVSYLIDSYIDLLKDYQEINCN